MNIKHAQFLLDTTFKKFVDKEGTVIYWRDCVLRPDMRFGEQGYLWVFADGETFHSYSSPDQVFE